MQKQTKKQFENFHNIKTMNAKTINKRKRTLAIKQGNYVDLYSFDYDTLYSDYIIDNDGNECLIDGLELISVPPVMHEECVPF